MPDDGLRYDRMVEDALRSVVNKALSFTAEHGLPGSHHFYITFRTGDPGVDIPAYLRERFPGEMTIVLQHQFWGLDVGPDAFAVTMTFSDVAERLTVPYNAIAAFADPSVRFGLQFDTERGEGDALDPAMASDRPENIKAANTGTEASPSDEVPAETQNAPGEALQEASPETPEDEADKVVALDSFRKK